MSTFKSGVDWASVGQERRRLFGDDPLHITPEPLPKWTTCQNAGCTYEWSDQGGHCGTCPGLCGVY